MANLKGADFEKQLRDVKIRLCAIGIKRQGMAKNDGLAHSYRVLDARMQYLKRFANFLSSNNFYGKLNKGITVENLTSFFITIIVKMSDRSREMLFSSFSGIIKGLRAKNISIDERVDYYFFQRLKDQYAARPNDKNFSKDRYLNPDTFVDILSRIKDRSVPIALLQYYCGFRASEAVAIAKKPEKYIQDNQIVGVRGKGGQEYICKQIDQIVITKLLESNYEKVSASTYYKDLSFVLTNNRAHDFRLSFAINLYSKLINLGIPEKEANLKVSKEMNHHRIEMSLYYLKRK